jgi:hypothetical protein
VHAHRDLEPDRETTEHERTAHDHDHATPTGRS